MSRRGKHTPRPAARAKRFASPNPARGTEHKPTGLRLWCFRGLVLLGVPLGLFALLELSFRILGFGYPTAFLLSQHRNDHQVLVQNNQFGWRFFGPQMSRLPCPISIATPKPPGTVRIFVFGESAAYGDPRPPFGLSRMLEALLSLRHTAVRFEVVNAAMTAINSHTIFPIARDCARAQGDLWVIYMGNNEVVGPFGAGTVFGPPVPPLPVIRANLALKSLRLGQLLDSARQWFQKPPPEKTEWGGMTMFLDHQVQAQDSRMLGVYDHFQKNLADIVQFGTDHGCGIVLSTVAVNLKDCAPFASAHRPGLSDAQLRQWDQLSQKGVEAQDARQFGAAAERFGEAARIDDTYAELRFRQGTCALALNQNSEARIQLTAARDLDVLRFRCDSRLNELIREVVSSRNLQNLRLADAEHAFAEASPQGAPGADLFYEHVHLTFEGNYLLARCIATEVEHLLPAAITAGAAADKPWPSIADCAARLGWNPSESRAAYGEMLVRVADPPFTSQLNHQFQVAHLASRSQPPPARQVVAQQAQALGSCAKAATLYPEDPYLYGVLASLKQSAGDAAGGVVAMRRSLELLPSSSEGWSRLGSLLVGEQKFAEAAAAFRSEFALDTQDVSALQNLAMCLIKENQPDDAIHEYRRALAVKPRFGPAWLGLGLALESRGRKDEALDCFHKALANRMHTGSGLATLARFCASRGWFDAAATNYSDALKLSAPDAQLNYEAGQVFGALARHHEAAQYYARAAALAPDWAQAQFQCGLELGQSDQPTEASARFQEAVRLMPDLIEARLNLGVALINQNRPVDALQQFEQVLQLSPTNALALQYIQSLRQKTSPKP
jgi:tetratricopeptide (TPR) repeat protein